MVLSSAYLCLRQLLLTNGHTYNTQKNILLHTQLSTNANITMNTHVSRFRKRRIYIHQKLLYVSPHVFYYYPKRCVNHLLVFIVLSPVQVPLPIVAVVQLLSCVQLFAPPWTVACQAPLSMRFPKQDYWSGLPFPPLGGLPDPGIEPRPPTLQADSLLLFHQGSPLYSRSLLVIYFTYNSSVYISIPISHFIPMPFLPWQP